MAYTGISMATGDRAGDDEPRKKTWDCRSPLGFGLLTYELGSLASSRSIKNIKTDIAMHLTNLTIAYCLIKEKNFTTKAFGALIGSLGVQAALLGTVILALKLSTPKELISSV